MAIEATCDLFSEGLRCEGAETSSCASTRSYLIPSPREPAALMNLDQTAAASVFGLIVF